MSRANEIKESIEAAASQMDPEQARKLVLALIATGALSLKALSGIIARRAGRGGRDRNPYEGEEGYYHGGNPLANLRKREGIGSVKSRSNTRTARRNKRR